MDERWELKNKKTGKLYWLTDAEMDNLKKLGLTGKYIISEIKPLANIKDPLKIEIKKAVEIKSTKHKKSE